MLAEVPCTSLFFFVVLSCAASKANGCGTGNRFFGFAIGTRVVAGGHSGGAIFGGAFKPAVGLGLDASRNCVGGGWGICYVLYESLGVCAASLCIARFDQTTLAAAKSMDLAFNV